MKYLKADKLVRLDPESDGDGPAPLQTLSPGIIGIDDEGRITTVTDDPESPSGPDEAHNKNGFTDLGDAVLVAGQVNAHSHAFQRAIRGRTEYLPADRLDDDFWSWREAMYRAALQLDADDLEAVARQAFFEMLRSGYTTVGEFHYVHHRANGEPYDDANEISRRMISAARDVGLRISLLRTAYHRGGYETPATTRQRRFTEPDVDTYVDRLEALKTSGLCANDDAVTVGIAPHSIRACPPQWLETLGRAARDKDLPLHIHVSEQTAELDQSREEYGTTPIDALESLDVLGPKTTLVHATHATERELDIIEERRPTVCACPSTERNLGDGFLPGTELVRRDVPICLGSDSQADIDPWSEMRLVEYHERLRHRARNILATETFRKENTRSSAGVETARVLWPMGANHGARALGLETGRLQEGRPADLVSLDLTHPTIAGATDESLASLVTLSAAPDAVEDVWVDGERVLKEGSHPAEAEIQSGFRHITDEI